MTVLRLVYIFNQKFVAAISV